MENTNTPIMKELTEKEKQYIENVIINHKELPFKFVPRQVCFQTFHNSDEIHEVHILKGYHYIGYPFQRNIYVVCFLDEGCFHSFDKIDEDSLFASLEEAKEHLAKEKVKDLLSHIRSMLAHIGTVKKTFKSRKNAKESTKRDDVARIYKEISDLKAIFLRHEKDIEKAYSEMWDKRSYKKNSF